MESQKHIVATSPAASDLQERARTLIRRMRDAGESYEMLASWFAAEFAAIRAEAKAEAWEDAAKALQAVPPDLLDEIATARGYEAKSIDDAHTRLRRLARREPALTHTS